MIRMTILGSSTLAYTGSRDYIRGADLYALFIDLSRKNLPKPDQPTRITSFKLVREVERDGYWCTTDSRFVEPEVRDDASATMVFETGEGTLGHAAFFEADHTIDTRVADVAPMIETIESTGDFAGRAVFKPMSQSRDFIDGLIEANKSLHSSTLTQKGLDSGQIKLIYIENFPPLAELEDREGMLQLEFTHLGSRSLGAKTFTLNSVSGLRDESVRWTDCKICYSYE